MTTQRLRKRRSSARFGPLISEILEPRIFLSVSSTVLGDAETTTGATATYSLTSAPYNSAGATITETYTVTGVGPMTYNGQAAFESDDTTSYPGETPSVQKNYLAQTSQGLIDYAQVGDGYTNTFNPPSVIFPATADAGVTYTLVSTGVTTGNTGNDPFTNTITATLSSDATTPITVPAGTYDCYVVTGTTSDVDTNGGGLSIAYSQTIDFAAGVGVVQEQVVQTPAQAQLNSQVPLGGTGGFIKTYSLTNFTSGPSLNFQQQPTNAAANATIKPPIAVQLNNSTGGLDTSATGTVTLTLQSASRLNTSTGALSGTTTEPIIGGVATFSDLSVTANGTYTLQVTDSNDDPTITSNKFKIGTTALTLDITSKAPGGTKGVKTGDTILYTIQETAKQPVQTDALVVTLPAGLVAHGISAGGTPAGNTITWNSNTFTDYFALTVPSGSALGSISNITVSGDDNVVYTDGSTDEATATNVVKLASSFEVDGTLHDADFRYPKTTTVSVSSPLGHVTVNLIDSTGATVDTTVTSGSGIFELTAKTAGSYTVQFVTSADFYLTAANGISNLKIYAAQQVTIPASNTTPIDLGDLVLPKTFFATAADILQSLNNYNTSGFQSLASFNIDLFQFNTTGAEVALIALGGTAANPTPLMDAAALKPLGGPSDPWVAAMRMMAGLSEVDSRFTDAFKLVDLAGKAVAVTVSAKFAGFAAKDLGGNTGYLAKAFPSAAGWTGAGFVNLSTGALALGQSARVGAFTALGAVISSAFDTAANLLGVSSDSKGPTIAAIFTVARYGLDIMTGTKLVDDLGFEAVFNLTRLAFDTALLHAVAGVTIRPDVGATYTNLLAIPDLLGIAGTYAITTMQDQLSACVSDRASYTVGDSTNAILSALKAYDAAAHARALKALYIEGKLNSASSIIRGGDGVAFQLNKSAGAFTSPKLASAQASLQATVKSSVVAIEEVLGTTLKRASSGVTILTIAAGVVGMLDQLIATKSVAEIVGIPAGASATAVDAVPLAGNAALPNDAAAMAKSSVQTEAIATVASTTVSSDAAVYLADLTQLGKLVKADNTTGITAMYLQMDTDQQSLFSNDLVPLDQQADAVYSQLPSELATRVGAFDSALNFALDSVSFASDQLDTWGANPATGNAKDVISQINSTIAAVKSAVSDAASVRSAVAGRSVPVTLEIAETSVPTNVSSGTTQTFTFTITNIGSQASTEGTITFSNGDGSIILASPAAQDLPALAPGASATFSWQAQVITSPDQSGGSVYQLDAVAGTVTASLSDSIEVG